MSRARIVALIVGLLAVRPFQAPSLAQGASVDKCAAMVSAPTRDTVPLLVVLAVHPYDPHQVLPASYQFDFGEAVRRHLVLPRPLGADLYEISGGPASTAHLIMLGNYSATITEAGRVIRASTTGGDRNLRFDNAVLAAMGAIDSTDMLATTAKGLPHDDVDIRVEVSTRLNRGALRPAATDSVTHSTTDQVAFEAGGQPAAVDSETVAPLFGFRAPLRSVTEALHQIPGTGKLKYPWNLRQANIEGEVQTTFVVGGDGVAEPGSLQVSRATHVDFVKAVLDAMPTLFFFPLQVEGCGVRSVLQTPFTFKLVR